MRNGLRRFIVDIRKGAADPGGLRESIRIGREIMGEHMNVTRRSLIKLGGVAALGALGAGTLAGCGQPNQNPKASASEAAATGGPRFCKRRADNRFRRDQGIRCDCRRSGESGLSVCAHGTRGGRFGCMRAERIGSRRRRPATWRLPSICRRPTKPPFRRA